MQTLEFDVHDVTETWVRTHAELVQWDEPMYFHNHCVHVGIVQAMNNAGRRERAKWFVVARQGLSSASRLQLVHVNELALETFDKACSLRQKYYSALEPPLEQWSRRNPLISRFRTHHSATAWMSSVTLDEAVAAVSTNTSSSTSSTTPPMVCVQPMLEPTAVPVVAWCMDNVEHTYIVSLDTGDHIDATLHARLYPSVHRLTKKRGGVCFLGLVSGEKCTFSIFDAVPGPGLTTVCATNSPPPPAVAFVYEPLLDRLLHIEAIVQLERVEHLGDRVLIAPFQPALTEHDIRLHTKIFIDTCQFSRVIYRLSVEKQ